MLGKTRAVEALPPGTWVGAVSDAVVDTSPPAELASFKVSVVAEPVYRTGPPFVVVPKRKVCSELAVPLRVKTVVPFPLTETSFVPVAEKEPVVDGTLNVKLNTSSVVVLPSSRTAPVKRSDEDTPSVMNKLVGRLAMLGAVLEPLEPNETKSDWDVLAA